MNKFRAFIAVLMGMNSGAQIKAYIWNPTGDKIPLAVIYFFLAVFWIFHIREVASVEEKTAETIDEPLSK